MAAFECNLVSKFAPTYHASRNERDNLAQLEPKREPRLALAHPPWRPYVYYSVIQLGTHEGERVYEINYLTIWDWDSGSVEGFGAHQWDVERVAILAAGPEGSRDPDECAARQAYFAAHEEVRLGGLLSLDNSCYVPYRQGRESGPDVWWSKGKHASFPSLEALRASTAGDLYDTPGQVARPGEYALVDAGTLERPTPAAPWITYKKGWGPQRISSVYSRLRDRLWDAAGNHTRVIPEVAEDQIKHIQLELKVDQTGQLDAATMRQAATILPDEMLWTTRKLS